MVSAASSDISSFIGLIFRARDLHWVGLRDLKNCYQTYRSNNFGMQTKNFSSKYLPVLSIKMVLANVLEAKGSKTQCYCCQNALAYQIEYIHAVSTLPILNKNPQHIHLSLYSPY